MALFLSWLMFGWFRHWLTTFAVMLVWDFGRLGKIKIGILTADERG
ncbi:hypothetical protein QUA69_01600 [Microcoleus sp. LAD1_D1]